MVAYVRNNAYIAYIIEPITPIYKYNPYNLGLDTIKAFKVYFFVILIMVYDSTPSMTEQTHDNHITPLCGLKISQ